MTNETTTWIGLGHAISHLLTAVTVFYEKTPILLIDEYDQPILSSYENGYRDELNDFFSVFYGSALKGNEYLSQALLTGIQRVAKESIFSRLNNIMVYTILDTSYSAYFGLNHNETEILLKYYDLELNEDVKNQYDGYLFGGIPMYNPWSILNYADRKMLLPYWINTSTNYLVKQSLNSADKSFTKQFHELIEIGTTEVGVKLETSFIELRNNYTLWGLLANSGYITIEENISGNLLKRIRIPNGEVRSEFQLLVAEQARIESTDLDLMLEYLLKLDMDGFMKIYKKIVLSCTSYYDAKEEFQEPSSYEDALHMLFLGMCISLKGMYKITSNIESGYGRSDITLESLLKNGFHVIIEFKQGENINGLKQQALNQIIENQYYTGLSGEVLCIGIAHNAKHCEMVYKILQLP